MSKIRQIEMLRLIQKNIVSFTSIGFFVVLAVALFLGMGGAKDAVESSVYSYLENQHFHDMEIMYPYGLDEEDMEKLRAVEGVTTAEGSEYCYANIKTDNGQL